MLGQGRGRWAVSQKPKLIGFFRFIHSTTQQLLSPARQKKSVTYEANISFFHLSLQTIILTLLLPGVYSNRVR